MCLIIILLQVQVAEVDDLVMKDKRLTTGSAHAAVKTIDKEVVVVCAVVIHPPGRGHAAVGIGEFNGWIGGEVNVFVHRNAVDVAVDIRLHLRRQGLIGRGLDTFFIEIDNFFATSRQAYR